MISGGLSASPHAVGPQFRHRGFVNFDQPGDVLVGVRGAHKPMAGRDMQPVLPVQQSQTGARGRVPLVRIPDAVYRTGRCMHPEHGAGACGYGRVALFLRRTG